MNSLAESARQRMITAIDDITGRDNCGEAVMMSVQPRWALVAMLPVFVAATFIIRANDLGPVVAGGIAGALAAGLTVFVSRNYLLGYCDGTVVLASSSRWSVKAVKIVGEYPYPVTATIKNGMLVQSVTIDGQTYHLAKKLSVRFRSITGTPT